MLVDVSIRSTRTLLDTRYMKKSAASTTVAQSIVVLFVAKKNGLARLSMCAMEPRRARRTAGNIFVKCRWSESNSCCQIINDQPTSLIWRNRLTRRWPLMEQTVLLGFFRHELDAVSNRAGVRSPFCPGPTFESITEDISVPRSGSSNRYADATRVPTTAVEDAWSHCRVMVMAEDSYGFGKSSGHALHVCRRHPCPNIGQGILGLAVDCAAKSCIRGQIFAE